MTAYDAIVIGGGVAGISTAYNLVREGSKTLLFDRQDVGRATDAGAGIISPYTGVTIPYRTEAQYHFTVKAAKYYPQLIEQLGAKQAGSTVYAECGILFVAVSEDELEAFEQARSKICKQLEQDGQSPESELPLLSSNEVRELFPTLAETKAAMLCRKAAQVDGRQLSQALYQAAEKQGLTVKDAGVEKLIIENQAVRGVVANGDTFFADKVAIAGGSWSPEFEEQCGVRIPVEPERGQIIHPYPPYPVMEMQVIWLVQDFTEDNGSPLFAPYSQKLCSPPDPLHFSEVAKKVTGKAGSVVISHGLCWHDSSVNYSQQQRVAIVGQYVPKFIRPKDERLHKVQPEVLDGASPKLKQLLGYDFKSAVSKDMGQLIGRQVRSVG
jgi:glycine/D-amino acid oxidase-like deaminating enzyme